MKVYIVFLLDDVPVSYYPLWDEIHIASSWQGVMEFLKRGIKDSSDGLTEFSRIKIDTEIVDEYFSKDSKCIGIKYLWEWLELANND